MRLSHELLQRALCFLLGSDCEICAVVRTSLLWYHLARQHRHISDSTRRLL